MKCLALVILSITFSNSYGLSCLATTDGKEMEISLDTKDSDQVMEDIEKLASVERDNQDICRVQFSTRYNMRSLSIEFTENLQQRTLNDQNVQIDISVHTDGHGGFVISRFLECACSTKKCDLEFIKKYFKWFINANRPDLPDQIAPLIFDDYEVSGQCLNSYGVMEECSSRQCLAWVKREHNQEASLSQSCVSNENLEATSFYFTIRFDSNVPNMLREYYLHCQYDGCNNENSLNAAIDIFHQEYDLKTILKVFGYPTKDEETTSTTTESSSSQRQTKSVQLSTTTSLVASTTTANFIESTIATTSTADPNYNQTGTTTQTNAGSCSQRTKGMIYVAWIMFIHHLLFRG